MLGAISDSFEDLTPQQREDLVKLLNARNDYWEASANYNRLRISQLTHPTPNGQEALSDFATTVVAPVRTHMNECMHFVLATAVDVEKLKSMLPMVLMYLSQSVNIPLLMAAANIETDMVEKIAEKATEFFKSGMAD